MFYHTVGSPDELYFTTPNTTFTSEQKQIKKIQYYAVEP